MKSLRGFVIGLVTALAIGGAATAAPRLVGSVRSTPTPSPSTTSTPVLVGQASPTPTPTDRSGTEGTDGGSDVTGLENAIAHVSANLARHPNAGLRNALAHLEANQAKHAEAHGSEDHGQKDHGAKAKD
jgi:hypothetical protein